jgi:hypothetical protein
MKRTEKIIIAAIGFNAILSGLILMLSVETKTQVMGFLSDLSITDVESMEVSPNKEPDND